MPLQIPFTLSQLYHSLCLFILYKSIITALCNIAGESCSEVYEVNGSETLGKGSYGSVYPATHRLTGDQRAVKVMNVDRVTSYYLRKLHTEISILKCVDHPNIIKLKDVFFGKRSVYLVTDLCKGEHRMQQREKRRHAKIIKRGTIHSPSFFFL